MAKMVTVFRCRFCYVSLLNHTQEQIRSHIEIKHPKPQRKQVPHSVWLSKKQYKQKKIEEGLRLKKQKKAHEALLIRPEGMSASDFYHSNLWMRLRYRVLKSQGRVCALCKTAEGPFHVDHIKPRSKYPELQLVEGNLQVLCKSCNMGKSNIDQTDWRST